MHLRLVNPVSKVLKRKGEVYTLTTTGADNTAPKIYYHVADTANAVCLATRSVVKAKKRTHRTVARITLAVNRQFYTFLFHTI